MKKLSYFILAVMLLLVSAFQTPVFAETADTYDAVIAAPEKAAPGDVIEVTSSARNINVAPGEYTSGILSTSMTLLFDTAVFEPVEYSAVIPSNFEHFERAVDFSEGKWTVFTAWEDDPFEGVTEDDAFVITFKLKVIGMPAAGESTLIISDVQASNGSMALFYGVGSQAVIHFEAFLPKADSGLRMDKERNYIISAVDNIKTSDFRDLFMMDPAKLSMFDNEEPVLSNDLVVSGMTITDGEETYTVIVKGDVDFDGKVTANDYTAVKIYFKGIATLTGLSLDSADVDENGYITTSDYLKIRRKIAGKYSFTV